MDEGLHFIVSNGPKVPPNIRVRTTIRKHAARNVILLRRQRGDFDHSKVAEPPDDTDDMCHVQPSHPPSTAVDYLHSVWLGNSSFRHLPLRSSPPQGSYESARAKYDFDVVDLSMFTNFNIGRMTVASLLGQQQNFLSLIGHRQWSFLQYIPARYGLNDCVSAATDCLLAKIRSIMAPISSLKTKSLQLYFKAIKALQAALEDTTLYLSVDTLCASQLLGLRELLNADSDEFWSRLHRGSTTLVQQRTPDEFSSDMDKALFAAHVGPVVIEPLVFHRHCYLADPSWIKLYQSMTRHSESPDDRSPLVIQFRSQMFTLPGLWHDLHAAVLDAAPLATNTALHKRCWTAHRTLVPWFNQYNAYCSSQSLISPTIQEFAKRREIFGVVLECLAVAKRLLATACVMQSVSLEKEIQQIAAQIMSLQEQQYPLYSWLFSSHEIGVAQSILATKDLWAVDLTRRDDTEDMARERYLVWDRSMKR